MCTTTARTTLLNRTVSLTTRLQITQKVSLYAWKARPLVRSDNVVSDTESPTGIQQLARKQGGPLLLLTSSSQNERPGSGRIAQPWQRPSVQAGATPGYAKAVSLSLPRICKIIHSFCLKPSRVC